MLKVQEKLNEEYKATAEEERRQKEYLKKEYDLKLADEARLLDIKTDKIRKLEAQLNNLIYKKSNATCSETKLLINPIS
jgi:hypothetical protein